MLTGEHPRCLVLPSASDHVGMAGEGLGDGQVAAGQADRAGVFAEHRHPPPLLPRRRPAPFRRYPGLPPRRPARPAAPPAGRSFRPAHPGSVPRPARPHSSFSGSQQLSDQPGLRQRQGPRREEAADPRQPGAQRPGQGLEVPRGNRAHRQGAGDLVSRGSRSTPSGRSLTAAQQRGPRRVLAGHCAQRGELPSGRPGFYCRPLPGDPASASVSAPSYRSCGARGVAPARTVSAADGVAFGPRAFRDRSPRHRSRRHRPCGEPGLGLAAVLARSLVRSGSVAGLHSTSGLPVR